jgi:hypothetical protein
VSEIVSLHTNAQKLSKLTEVVVVGDTRARACLRSVELSRTAVARVPRVSVQIRDAGGLAAEREAGVVERTPERARA